MNFPEVDHFPHITRDQMIEVDRLMIEVYGITLFQMMENAGRSLAVLARDRFLGSNPDGKSVLVMVGSRGNGGGAMVAARRLASWGAEVQVVLSHSLHRFTEVTLHQLNILNRTGVPISDVPQGDFDLLIDGLIGYSLKGAPRGRSADLIHFANDHGAPVLSLDVPSGLDITSGEVHTPTVNATSTLTLALPKTGLRGPEVGELFCADISVPPALYAEETLGIKSPLLFSESDIVKII